MKHLPILELIDASMGYPDSSHATLSGVNLSIYPGGLLYFIGRIGSGKSTLMRTLYGELRLTGGRGWVADYDLRKLRDSDIPFLRRRIGIVFQDYQLLGDRTVFQNLEFVLRAIGWRSYPEIRNRIDEVLSLVEMGHKAGHFPQQLSGGERQRVAIARSLLNMPSLILADEPTANLDPQAAEDLIQLFKNIVAGGCTVVIAFHNMSILKNHPSRTFRFVDGVVEEVDMGDIVNLAL